MKPASKDTIRDIQRTLGPYVRPREEVARIRQILAVHLDSYLQDGTAIGPLALVGANCARSLSLSKGLQKAYLDALSANIQARQEFAACSREQRTPGNIATTVNNQLERLQEHLAAIRLQQRHEKLRAIERALNTLRQKPAASAEFLNPREIFRDSRPLPDVPKELVTALALDPAASAPHVKDSIDQLEKHVLRTKLVLQNEEQLLEKVKARSTARTETISGGAKLEALNQTRAELISWIEVELGKASGDDGGLEGEDSQAHRAPADSINMEAQLASIAEKYAQYLDARKRLLQLVGQQPQPDIKPPKNEVDLTSSTAPKPPPASHLLTPYLERLLATAREQKGLIAHKSHLNAAISKKMKENSQVLDHLAEESLLIPAHLMPGAPSAHAAFADAVPEERSSASNRVRPWVFAADSAKITTLETVAEKIEEGQIALEGSMGTLGEVDRLLGRLPLGHRGTEPLPSAEEDLWLHESQSPEGVTKSRRRASRAADKPAQPKTAWDVLDGNLGLLRVDKDTP